MELYEIELIFMALTAVDYVFVKQRNGTWLDDGCAVHYRSDEIGELLKDAGFPDRIYFLDRANPGDVVELLDGRHLVWYYKKPIFYLS